MSLVTFVANSDHCPQRTVYSFVNSNFKDFELRCADFIHSRSKIFYTNCDTYLNKLNELQQQQNNFISKSKYEQIYNNQSINH